MSLSRRLIITVAASVGIAIAAVAVSMGLLARNALIAQAENQAALVAGLIAGEANRAELTSDEIDRLVELEMETQAIAIAQLAEASRGDPPLATQLAEVTASSTIDDIWLFDPRGELQLRVAAGLGGAASGDLAVSGIDPRALDALVSGRRFSIGFRSTPPDRRELPMRYVGVRAGGGGVVLLGSLARQSDGLQETIGLNATLVALVGQADVQAIWVVDDALAVLGAATDDRGDDPGDGASPVREVAPAEARLATQTLNGVGARSYLGDDALHVAAPILDRGGVATGAAILRMSRDQLDGLFANHVKLGLIAAAAAFAIGSLIATVSARRIAQPVMALTRAAEQVDTRSFEPQSLDSLADRQDELGVLTRVFQTMARDVQMREDHLEGLVRERTLDLEEKNTLLEGAKQRMETELEIAHALQGAILPKAMPPHPAYSGDALMTPAWEMGGDFYDFFTLPDGRLGLVIADVSGKGVSAAFFMAITRTVLRAAAREHASAGACLREVNDVICAQNPHYLFVTLFYGILDPDTGQFSFANAGHNPPQLIRPDGVVDALPLTGGVAVGVMPELAYAERALTLEPGTTLFLYTDGISEAMDEQMQEFTEERLAATLAGGHQSPVAALLERVTAAVDVFVGEAPQSDDITCLVLRFNGVQS